MKTSIRKLLAIFTIFAITATAFYSVSAQEEEAEGPDDQMTAVFINEHPRDEIELYWVDPEKDEDDPERLVGANSVIFCA